MRAPLRLLALDLGAESLLRAQQRGGSVIFVASKNGLVGGRNASAYSSAKALRFTSRAAWPKKAAARESASIR